MGEGQYGDDIVKDEVAEVTHKGVLYMQVCVPYDWTDGQVLDFAEREYPCGTQNRWSIRREGDKFLAGHPERVSCESRHGFVHVMLDA